MTFRLLFVGYSVELQYIVGCNMLEEELQAADQGFPIQNQVVFQAIDTLGLYL